MTKLEKNEIFDRICRALTDYEDGYRDKEDLYETLVVIANEWEEITGEDE